MPPPLPAPRPTRPTPRPDPAPARRARATLRTRLGAAGLLAGGYVALHLAWTAAGVGGPAQRQLVGDLLIVPLFGVLAAAAWLAGRNAALRAETRRGWRWLALSYAMLWAANVAWASRIVAPVAPSVDLAARVVVLASYLPLLVGLLSFPAEPVARSRRLAIALDLATVLLGVALAMWQFLVQPIVGRLGMAIGAKELLSLAQPAADFVVLAALALVLHRRADAGGRPSLLLLAAGHAVSIVTGLVITLVFAVTGPPDRRWDDTLWVVSAALIFQAAALQVRRRAPASAPRAAAARPLRPAGDPLRFLPALGVALGSALLLTVTRPALHSPAGVVILGSVAITLLVLLRQVRTLADHRRAEAALAASEARYRLLVDGLGDVVFRLDADGRWRYLNRAWSDRFGLPVEASLGAPALDLVHAEDRDAAAAGLRALASGACAEWQGELRIRTPLGTRWSHWQARAVHGADGALVDCTGTLTDITDRVSREQRLRHRASHDELTGLANRAAFRERVQWAVARLARAGAGHVAVLFLDLDGFKRVNDELGHAAGDALLVEVAARLRDAVRAGDLVARLGGDEFAVLLDDVRPGVEARHVSARITEAIAAPFRVDGAVRWLGVSVGLAEGGGEIAPDALLRQADAAMYAAKRERRLRAIR